MSYNKFFEREIASELVPLYSKWKRVCARPGIDPFNTRHILKSIMGSYDVMPGRKSKSSGATSKSPTQAQTTVKWVRVALGDTDIAYAQEFASDVGKLAARIAAALADGWGFSVKFDAIRKNYTCFITSPTGEGFVETIGISAYAPDGLSAAAACFCKWDIYAADPTAFSSSSNGVGIG